MVKARVGVLRGGLGHEYEVSLATGQSVLEHLPAAYHGRDILIDRAGVWHLGGLPTAPQRIARQVDVFFNALHGEYGEDGKIQSELDQLGLPYTGSGTAPSALGMNKEMSKDLFRRAGLKVSPGLVVRRDGNDGSSLSAREVFQKVSPPWVIKPNDRGSSVGLFFARNIQDLAQAIVDGWVVSPTLLVEHYLRGREATAGVIDDFRGAECYALPPIEIRRPKGKLLWDYQDKYSGQTAEICPGNFTDNEKRELEKLAITAHRALGLRHYSRSDFILTPHGIYLLETNSLPGLTKESLLPKALKAVGCPYPNFLDHILTLALNKN
ncbi:MAG: D-alanine--D-alanine ligase [Candidatus Vogelbacteria bacterium]